MDRLRVIEYFSGIGGWSWALSTLCEQNFMQNEKKLSYEIVAAYDINPIANIVYEHNSNIKPNHKSIEKLTIKQVEKLNANMWVMSPPCQPHTRNNTTEKRDDKDPRSSSFIHLIDILANISNLPKYIALENVVGFEASSCCQMFIEMLIAKKYKYVQYQLTPSQFGIPNERPRYLLIASLDTDNSRIANTSYDPTIIYDYLLECVDGDGGHESTVEGDGSVSVDNFVPSSSNKRMKIGNDNVDTGRASSNELNEVHPSTDSSDLNMAVAVPVAPLASFIDQCMSLEETQSLLVPESILQKSSSWCFDIVSIRECDKNKYRNITSCYTKAYSRYIKGTGSVLLVDGTDTIDMVQALKPDGNHVDTSNNNESNISINMNDPEHRVFNEDWQLKLKASGGKLRYFSPTELLRLFGFPKQFNFPMDKVKRKQCYELIGNSVNTIVIAKLLENMFCLFEHIN